METSIFLPTAWTRPALERSGFQGWYPWSACPGALDQIDRRSGGVYVVYRESAEPPTFLETSPAGTWNGPPSVVRGALDANWVSGANVLNIGKADHGRLKARLKEYVQFGRGGHHKHYGGRLIWQLAESETLLIAWMVLPPIAVPLDVETAMISDFRDVYGKPPFANRPNMLGR